MATPPQVSRLHVRHLGAFVDARLMRRVLFQDGEDPRWRAVPRCARADRRAPDAHAIAKHKQLLLGNAHDDNDRPGRRNLRIPDVVARLELLGHGRHLAALGE